jgi:hypothetical protein
MECRYVGKTNNLSKRYYNHISDCHLKSKTHKNSWIKSLKKLNLRPIMRVISITTIDNINRVEISAIKNYTNLTNMTEGGDGLSMASPELRKKISDAVKGKKRPPCSEEKKVKISLAQKGKPRKPWTPDRYKKHCMKVIVECVNTGGILEFISLAECARTLFNKRTLTAAMYKAYKISKSYKNYFFRYIGQ